MPPKTNKKNISFQIELLKAKIGKQPKITRCSLVAKAEKAKVGELDTEKAEEELRRLEALKQQGVEHHERRILRKTLKEGVRPEVQKLTKRLKSQQMSLDKLRGSGAESVPEKVLKEKESTVCKLEAQLNQLKHLDLDALTTLAWESLSQNVSVDEVVAAHAKAEDSDKDESARREAQQIRTVQLRVLKTKLVANTLQQMKDKKHAGNAGQDASGSGKKERDILAKLMSASRGAGGSGSGSDEEEEDGDVSGNEGGLRVRRSDEESSEAGSSDDDDDHDVSNDGSRQSESEDDDDDVSAVGEDSDGIFVGSLKASAKPKKAEGGKNRNSAKKPNVRKNRMGQQARRQLAEKKFGTRAKHLKEGQGNARSAPNGKFDGQKGGNVKANGKFGGQRGGNANANDSKFGGQTGGNAVAIGSGNSGQWKSAGGAAANPGPSKNQAGDHGGNQEKLHPSWEASQKRKQQAAAVTAFAGKKIKLGDDD